jgi:hypothetical protein
MSIANDNQQELRDLLDKIPISGSFDSAKLAKLVVEKVNRAFTVGPLLSTAALSDPRLCNSVVASQAKHCPNSMSDSKVQKKI